MPLLMLLFITRIKMNTSFYYGIAVTLKCYNVMALIIIVILMSTKVITLKTMMVIATMEIIGTLRGRDV